jgi:ketosteroid isomerase-like protein
VNTPEHIELFLRGNDAINRLDVEATLALVDENTVFEPPDIRDLGDGRLLAIGTIRIRGRESQAESDVITAAVVEFRDGRLARYKDYGDKRLALEAAGFAG